MRGGVKDHCCAGATVKVGKVGMVTPTRAVSVSARLSPWLEGLAGEHATPTPPPPYSSRADRVW
jgi:hypothetical protein